MPRISPSQSIRHLKEKTRRVLRQSEPVRTELNAECEQLDIRIIAIAPPFDFSRVFHNVARTKGKKKLEHQRRIVFKSLMKFGASEKMCVAKISDKGKLFNRNKLGRAVRGMLHRAQVDERLICGLLSAIAYLERNPDDVVFCVLPETRPGDAANHIQTVLLQAFCYENSIPVIQVDSCKKLGESCGVSSCDCAIILKDSSLLSTPEEEQVPMSPIERELADFYSCTLEEFPRPIIELPI